MKCRIFDIFIRVREREEKTRRLIEQLRDRVVKRYPVRSPFLIPDQRGRGLSDYIIGKYIGKGCNGVVFKNGSKLKTGYPLYRGAHYSIFNFSSDDFFDVVF